VHPVEALTRRLESWLGTDKVSLQYAPRAALRPAEAMNA
jgi:hypothetical protein